MTKLFRSFIADESGATAIEYGLIAALVSVAAIVSLQTMGTSLSGMFGKVSSVLQSVVGSGG
jgi:pilus assembly protein Flp/PilA